MCQDSVFRILARLDRKRLGQETYTKKVNSIRGVFDKQTRVSSFPSREGVYPECGAPSPDHPLPSIPFNRVDPAYFKTMRIPLPLGREFLNLDR